MMNQTKHRLRRKVLTAAAGVGAGAAALTCGAAHALSGLAMNRKFPAYGKYLNISGGKKDKAFLARRDAAAQALRVEGDVLQLRQHSASQKARRSRNQILLKHPITSETKDRC